ncbi:dihydrofolate reductase [Candidatus Epulonipiscium viviparus]|uniref:dihydrofolate reductase n=1 Tax=Candidatus Epulonipiscium viviparus TaxID=420336 RepID=UPI00273808E2|nr:dihydrofolate reductase [Candidatus Epulopiscium viviparus]
MIVAVSKNGQIGIANELPWNIKEDMNYFRKMTTAKTVIMGRKTFNSIGRPLPNRRNIVLTTNTDLKIAGVEVVTNFAEALIIAREEDAFVIGGGQIYELFMPYAEELYITEVDVNIDGDAAFPEYRNKFVCVETIEKSANDSKYNYRFTKWIAADEVPEGL